MKMLYTLLIAVVMACVPPSQLANSAKMQSNQGVKFDLDSLFEEDAPKPEIACDSHPCVVNYRFNGEVNENTVQSAIDMIDAANAAGADRFVLELNSPGGSVFDGFELAKTIENSRIKLECVVDMEAASMGAYILQSCPTRIMTKRSVLMFHEPAIGVMGFSGSPNAWEAIAEALKAMRQSLAVHCSYRMSVGLDYYRSRTDGGLQWWMNYDEALKVGAVDKVVNTVGEVIGK